MNQCKAFISEPLIHHANRTLPPRAIFLCHGVATAGGKKEQRKKKKRGKERKKKRKGEEKRENCIASNTKRECKVTFPVEIAAGFTVVGRFIGRPGVRLAATWVHQTL